MVRLLVASVILAVSGGARAADCTLILRSDGGVCVAKRAAPFACAWSLGQAPLTDSPTYRVAVVDKATGKWSPTDVERSFGPSGMPGALAILLADRIPTTFNGVETGTEKNACSTEGFFGSTTLVFVASGRTTKVTASDVETVWRLLKSGATLQPW